MKIIYSILLVCVSVGLLTAQNIPVDFEPGGNGDQWTWTVFENIDNPPLEIIANPDQSGINTSATVAKFTARQNGQPFAGCETMHGSDIGSFVIDSSNSTIRIMVWKSVISDVGIKLVEASSASLGEIKIANTKVNEWEQLTFDFSSRAGITYDQIVIFPDFGSRTSDNIIYFDNIWGPEASDPSSLSNINSVRSRLYPNPVKNVLTIENEVSIDQIQILDLQGKIIDTFYPENRTLEINTSMLRDGFYMIKSFSGDAVSTHKFLKN